MANPITRAAPKRKPRDVTLTMRMTTATKQRLDRAADETGHSVSRMAEDWINRGYLLWLEEQEVLARLEQKRGEGRARLLGEGASA